MSELTSNITYAVEILMPGTKKWLSCGFWAELTDYREAINYLEKAQLCYSNKYKFRLKKITHKEDILLESNGEQTLANQE